MASFLMVFLQWTHILFLVNLIGFNVLIGCYWLGVILWRTCASANREFISGVRTEDRWRATAPILAAWWATCFYLLIWCLPWASRFSSHQGSLGKSRPLTKRTLMRWNWWDGICCLRNDSPNSKRGVQRHSEYQCHS